MSNDKQWEEPAVLDEEQLMTSLAYVCYERSMYHYLQRAQGIRRFPWLLLDRVLLLSYVSGVNEALQYRGDGFADLQRVHEVRMTNTPEQLLLNLSKRIENGWVAHAMMTTERPDGSTYITSNLVEGLLSGKLLVTKTNETMRTYRVPVPVSTFMEKFPKDSSGMLTLTFTKFPPSLLQLLRTSSDEDFLRIVYRDLYKYQWNGKDLTRLDVQLNIKTNGIGHLRNYLGTHLDSELGEKLADKGLQLMMNKHIANKITPLTRAWSDALPCLQTLSGQSLAEVHEGCAATNAALDATASRFVLLMRRPNSLTLDSYLAGLKHLELTFEAWKLSCLSPLTTLIGER